MTLSLGQRSVLSPTTFVSKKVSKDEKTPVRGVAYVVQLEFHVSNVTSYQKVTFYLLLVTTSPDRQDALIVSMALPLRMP